MHARLNGRTTKELDSSREEILLIRSKMSAERARSAEVVGEVEVVRKEASETKKAWRKTEQDLQRRLREAQEVESIFAWRSRHTLSRTSHQRTVSLDASSS